MSTHLAECLKSYGKGLGATVAFQCEAQARHSAAEQVDFFIEGLESGVNDCAIYAGPGKLQNTKCAAETLFVKLREALGDKVLAPLDITRCSARCDGKKGVQFWIHISPDRRKSCQALILVSPKEPDFYGLIPIGYFPNKDTTEGDGVYFPPIRLLWTLHPLPAFPPEYTSFMFPVTQFGDNLKRMQAYYNQSSDDW